RRRHCLYLLPPLPGHHPLDCHPSLSARRPPARPLLPYTTLFRSSASSGACSTASSPYRPSETRTTTRESERCGHFAETNVAALRSEEHTSELQSRENLVCRLLLEKKNNSRNISALADAVRYTQLI